MIIYVNQKKSIELKEGSTAEELIQELHLSAPSEALSLEINGEKKDFSHPLFDQDQVTIKNFDDPEGKEVFWHTSAHVLAQAVLRLWPEAIPTIGPPIDSGFYYDFANLTISEEDFPKIEQEMERIVKENFRPQRVEFASKEAALKAFSKNPYKQELIQGFQGTISGYQQGDFFDLCRGPHIPYLGKIKALKLLKTSGAYWKGNAKNEMLTRIYGTAFPDRKSLKNYLKMLEEAKKRDHKILGPKLGLFSFKEEAPGMPFIHPKGLLIWNHLLDFLRHSLDEHEYIEIKTPTMMSKQLWQRSGHWDHYRENMYLSEVENKEFAIKPMNCPGCMLYYKSAVHSYREFPLRVAEIGHVHRYEPSGALNGLFRVRAFHQDDAHIFLRPGQIQQEILDILDLADHIYTTFGLSYKLELSTRPEKSMGTDEEWSVATDGLKNALDDSKHDYKINEGDGAFYGPKIDIHIRDALGRYWQCGTIQLDLSLPEKFSLEYIDSDGQPKRPIMLHRALFGSIERFFGILIEHFSGKFPLWMSSNQVAIIPVAERHVPYAKEVEKNVKNASLICHVDDTNESVSKKVRLLQLMKTNYILTVGDREVEEQTVSLRTRDNVVHGAISLDAFLEKVLREKDSRSLVSPFCSKDPNK
ncbi:MAG: threonine--tRNA ligase [Chlamydiota bacterium]